MARWLIALMLLLAATPASAQLYRPKDHPQKASTRWTQEAPAEIAVRTRDGLALNGLYWGGRSDLPLLVFFHGRSADRFDAAHYMEPLAAAGYAVVIASYRGYGGNPGKPDEKGLNLDGAAFAAFARRLRPDGKIYALGHSLGASVALTLAADRAVDEVITLGAFPDLRSVAPKITRAFLPDRFSNMDTAARLARPAILIQGRYDDVVSMEQGQQLLGAAPVGSVLLVLDKQDHRPAMSEIVAILTAIVDFAAGQVEPLAQAARARGFAMFRKTPTAP
jgi:pimeloyl-ACP methyl ester carboxylesterase